MRDAKPLTIPRQRLRWLLRQDPFVSWFWLRINEWSIPREAEGLFLISDVLRKIERKFYPALEDHK